jgi:predicted GTPase
MAKHLSGSYKTYRLADIQKNIRYYPLDIMLVGPTGVGKSSTLNALLQDEKAKVGYGVDPETVAIQDYELNDYIRLWDTPGLGDNPEKDKSHFKKIEELLTRKVTVDEGEEGKKEIYLIDLVIVLIDGSNRDNGSIIKLLNEVIFKDISANRILIVVNQADMVMKGHHWQSGNPDAVLTTFIREKAVSVRRRISESTGKSFRKPVCYSATNNFNLYSLLDYIIDNIHFTKRRSINKKIKLGKKENKQKKGRRKFEDFNKRTLEVYETLKTVSPNSGSCEDKDCGCPNCYGFAMKIAAGKDHYGLCPFVENVRANTHFFNSFKFVTDVQLSNLKYKPGEIEDSAKLMADLIKYYENNRNQLPSDYTPAIAAIETIKELMELVKRN